MKSTLVDVRWRALATVLVSFAILRTGHELSIWGGLAREARWTMMDAALAAAAVVFMVPVLLRGDRIQRTFAVILLVLPVVHLLGDFALAIHYAL